MAVPRLQCGACGGALTVGQNPCPHCGEPVDGVQTTAPPIACPVCGHPNIAGSAVCSSCGVRLGARRPKGFSRPQRPAAAPAERRKRFEPWQAASVVAILALIAFVVYLEWTPSRPAPAPAATAPPGLMPQLQKVDLAPLEAAVKAAPNDAGALLRLANGQHDNGLYTAAIASYGRFLRLRPDDADARVDMGICYFELGRLDTTGSATNYLAALREMRTALEHQPDHQPAVFNTGIVHLAMGNLQESRTWLAKAVAMNKESALGRQAQKILDEHSF